LTKQGTEIADALLPEQHLIEQKLVDSLDRDEKQTLCELLNKITKPFNP